MPARPLPKTAMILAAGRGTRMAPLTDDCPKPLLPLAGRPIIDHLLEKLRLAGIENLVVNLHHLGSRLRTHFADRDDFTVAFSDEADKLLDTGGGLLRALPLLREEPFFVVNGDCFWTDQGDSLLARLAGVFDPAHCDAVLALQPKTRARCYNGPGDYSIARDGRPRRRAEAEALSAAPYVFSGIQLLTHRLFDDLADRQGTAFSSVALFDRAQAAGRLRVVVHHGDWVQLNTPDGLAEAGRIIDAEKVMGP